jgi:hypothetical protein
MKKLALRQPSKSVRNEEVFKIRETPIELEGYYQQLQNLHTEFVTNSIYPLPPNPSIRCATPSNPLGPDVRLHSATRNSKHNTGSHVHDRFNLTLQRRNVEVGVEFKFQATWL